MSFRHTAAALCLPLILLLSSCDSIEAERKPSPVKQATDRRAAPAFSLKDSNGRNVTLADYKGKVVLLNFWATWCGPCKIEIPWFIDFEQKYKDRGFAVLGVALDEEGWEIVKPYIDKNKINYRIVMGTEDVAQLYGGMDSLPTTFVIDTDGKIASTHIGLISKSEYEHEIVELLDGTKRTDAGRTVAAASTAN